MGQLGVGSLVTIAVLLGGGMLLLFRWTGTKELFSLTMAIILLVGTGIIFVVKGAEKQHAPAFLSWVLIYRSPDDRA